MWVAETRGAAKVTKADLKSKRGKVVGMNFKQRSMVQMWHQVIQEVDPSSVRQHPAEASRFSAYSLISE